MSFVNWKKSNDGDTLAPTGRLQKSGERAAIVVGLTPRVANIRCAVFGMNGSKKCAAA